MQHYHKLDDFSQEAIDRNLLETQKFVDRFEAIDTTGFPDQEKLNKPLMVRDLKFQLEEARFKDWEMPVAQQDGWHLLLPQLVSLLSYQSVKDYQDYISRLNQVPRLFDQTIIQMQKGMVDKLMPPRFLLDKVGDRQTTSPSRRPPTRPSRSPSKSFLNPFPSQIRRACANRD